MNDIHAYNTVVRKLRHFFQIERGYVEVPAQSRLSILAACEDPNNLTEFKFGGRCFPLPQTGQMWLEYELMNNPGVPGVFCITTSYRDEPNPIPGRHDKIFPMFEFEAKGGIAELKRVEADLVEYLGFPYPVSHQYNALCKQYGVTELSAEEELKMQRDYGNVVSLEYFPQHTHPFWNMKHDENGIYNKVDVILYGMETIGSAERSTDVESMRHNFFTISDGQYAKLLFNAFGEERVMKELDEYFKLPMIPRFGAGIGITRLVRAVKLANLLPFEQREPAKAVA